MNPRAHYVEKSEATRHLKKTLNRPPATASQPARPERPANLPTVKIKDALRDWNRDGRLSRRSPHTLEARKRIVERFETFLIDSKATCVTTDDIAAFFELL